MVDAVVSVFLDKLLNPVVKESEIVLSDFNLDKFDQLRKELQLMQSFLKDAERLKRKNEGLRQVMDSLREFIYEAEDIFADCRLHGVSPQSFPRCLLSPSKLPFRHQTGKRLRKINEEVAVIERNISSYLSLTVPLLAQPPQKSSSVGDDELRWSSPLYDHSQVVGLESDAAKVRSWLLEEAGDPKSTVAIGIVGMGGVGKTTMAQIMFNDRGVEDWFERRMWVSVSRTFTEEQIMRSMLRSLGDAGIDDDRSELLRKINRYLRGKRYLLVMDDVWGGNDNISSTNNNRRSSSSSVMDLSWWERIQEGLPRGNGSIIIVTTRNGEVAQKMGVGEARTHRPQILSTDNSRLLFRKIAFAATRGECVHPELEDVGNEIVDKCGGLPLAIKAVGGIMLCKQPHYHEWRRIADHFREELAENGKVEASLQLSYDELPPHLKSCFLCLCLYPEDCEIPKEQLVHWWIGEAFVPLRNGRLTIESGEDCFIGMTNRCLLEVVERSYDGGIHTCKVHDMVRDVAINMASEEKFAGSEHSRRFSVQSDDNQKKEHHHNHNLHHNHDHHYHHRNNKGGKNLRALLSTTKTGEVNRVASSAAREFCTHPYLRVLDVSKSIFDSLISDLLGKIGSLHHLAYLCLSRTHPLIELPPSLQALRCCKILDLSYCQSLKALPQFITAFEDLMVLDVTHCGSLEYLPRGLGNLSTLQVLFGFRPAKPNQPEGARFSELRSLTQLRKLGLELNSGDTIGAQELDSLSELHRLRSLTISCFDSYGSELAEKVDKLSLPPQLHELSLKFYPGETSPQWLNPRGLPMLRYLSVCSGNIAKMKEEFWGNGDAKWKIEGLMLEAVSDLDEDWSRLTGVMPNLRTVRACWCPRLRSFPIEGVGYRGGRWEKEHTRNIV